MVRIHKFLIYTAVASLSLSSCINSFLDREPLDMLTDQNVWSDQNAITAYMANMYNQVAVEPHEWLINWGTLGHYTDESMRSYSWGIPYNPTFGNGYLEYWAYGNVRVVNEFLENIEKSDVLTQAQKKQYLAEGHFIRAFHYFNMVKRYGGVPIIDVAQVYNPNDFESLRVNRSTEKEAWDFVAAECDKAIEGLSESYGAEERYKPTKFAALALKSRAMLYAGSIAKYGAVQISGLVGIPADQANNYYAQSIEASEQIIKAGKFDLYEKKPDKAENYQHLFLDKSFHEEAIYLKAYAQPDKGHLFDYAMAAPSYRIDWGTNTSPTLEFVEKYEYADGSDGALEIYDENQEPILYDKPEDIFKNKDPRFFASILYPGSPWQGNTQLEVRRGVKGSDGVEYTASNYTDEFQEDKNIKLAGKDGLVNEDCTRTGFYIKKFMDPVNKLDWGQSETNFMVFRYAETLLNFAEAKFEIGDLSAGIAGVAPLEALNKVRSRAGMPPKSSLNLDVIRNERAVELAFENLRYWDIVRWRTATSIMNNTTFSCLYPWFDYGKKKYYYRRDANVFNKQKTFLEKNYYQIIPGVSSNPNLIQNPGY